MSLDAELKVCELCGRLFVREIQPNPCPDCPYCQAHPPAECEVTVVVDRSYRVVGIKIEL